MNELEQTEDYKWKELLLILITKDDLLNLDFETSQC